MLLHFEENIQIARGTSVGSGLALPGHAQASAGIDPCGHANFQRAFAFDPRALATARALVAAGRDRALAPLERVFVYLPFEHSESLDDQHEAVRLFTTLRDDPQAGGYLEWAVKHFEVVQRFGRFPHRNEALGRASTAEEIAFLAQPGSRF